MSEIVLLVQVSNCKARIKLVELLKSIVTGVDIQLFHHWSTIVVSTLVFDAKKALTDVSGVTLIFV